MNDLASLLQQVNDMNASWLPVAVTAQSAFDTIDAAALKTQQTLKDTIADVNGLNKSLGGIKGNISVSVNNDQITATQNQIKQLQSQAGTIGKPASGNGINAATNTESSSFADKAITAATKSIVKGGITSVIEDKALGTAVKEELANGFRGLVADEAGEFVASSAGGILGDVLGGGIAGGLEVALGAVAPEIVLPVVAAGALIKGFMDHKAEEEKKQQLADDKIAKHRDLVYALAGVKDDEPEMPLRGNPIEDMGFARRHSKDPNFYLARVGHDFRTSEDAELLRSMSIYNLNSYKSYRETYDPLNVEGLRKPLPGAYKEQLEKARRGEFPKMKKPEKSFFDEIPTDLDKTVSLKEIYRVNGEKYVNKYFDAVKKSAETLDNSIVHLPNTHPFSTATNKLLKTFPSYIAATKRDLQENKDEHSPEKQTQHRSFVTTGNLQPQGKVINININKAFIENFSIHAQNVQQGYDNLKQKVEEIFLEILNSANAVHE